MPRKNKEEQAAYDKQYYALNKDRLQKQGREWHRVNKAHCKEVQQQYLINNREKEETRWKTYKMKNQKKIANYHLKKTYGITIEQKKQMYISQGGMCAICKKRFQGKTDLCIDHDHTTGKVRQLLCRKCNLAIGYFNDDVLLLASATEYLNKWSKQ